MANGGGAIGGIAQGGLAIGWLARGGDARGVHVWSPAVQPDDATRALFERFAWLVGPSSAGPAIHYGLAWTVGIAIVIAVLALLPVALARRARDPIAEELSR
jgi:hypothetical protein